MMDDDTIERLLQQAMKDPEGLEIGDFARACYTEGQRDAQERIAELEAENERLSALAVDQKGVLRDLLADIAVMKQRLAEAKLEAARLRQAADNALGVLLACCVPAEGVDDRAAILDAQRMLRASMRKEGGDAAR